MTDLTNTEAFITRHKEGYRELAEQVLAVCKDVQKSTSGIIYRAYSRAEKQNGNELKDASKILEKIQPPVNDEKLLALHDIIGVTIVIYYPDDATSVFERVKKALRPHSIKIAKPPRIHNEGYYALHAVLRSSKGNQSGLYCELQIKTVLHDAWSAKMHDLTYKPAGSIDGRLKGLMEAVSSQIEAIEQQSITIRNIITGRQRLETRAFQTLCDTMFRILEEGILEQTIMSNTIAAKWSKQIDAVRKRALKGNSDVRTVQKIIDEIDKKCIKPPLIQVGWLLVAKLGGGLLFGDRTRDVATQVDRFLRFARSGGEGTDFHPSVFMNIPNAFYVVGDLRRAAEYSDLLCQGSYPLDDESKLGLHYNGLTYLLELEHIKPTRSAALRKQLQRQIADAIADPRMQERPNAASAVMDSHGLFKIVFGETPQEIRDGIDLCTRSAAIAAD